MRAMSAVMAEITPLHLHVLNHFDGLGRSFEDTVVKILAWKEAEESSRVNMSREQGT